MWEWPRNEARNVFMQNSVNYDSKLSDEKLHEEARTSNY